VGPFGEEVINDNGDKSIDVCEQNSLKILNVYFKHKRIRTSVHKAPRYTGAKIYNRLHHCQTKFWFKIGFTYSECSRKWQKKRARMGLEIQDRTIYLMLFADNQLRIAQDYEDLEYMIRKLIEEYELWGLKLNIKKKTKYMSIGDPSRDLQLEDGKGTISHVSEYVYLGVRITEGGNHEPDN
jgi:hypothetical protein